MSSSINTVDNLITFLLRWREVWSIPTKSSIWLSECDCSWWLGNPWPKTNIQWLFLVPRKRWDRWHTMPQLAVYFTYNILPSGGLYATYQLLRGTRNNHWNIVGLLIFSSEMALTHDYPGPGNDHISHPKAVGKMSFFSHWYVSSLQGSCKGLILIDTLTLHEK